jgi:hypothetical protein
MRVDVLDRRDEGREAVEEGIAEARDHQVSFRVREDLHVEILEAAAERGVPVRAFILMALRDAGIGIREDDLTDRRRGETRGSARQRGKERPGAGDVVTATVHGPQGQLVDILRSARRMQAKGGGLQSGAKIVIHVAAPAPAAVDAEKQPDRTERDMILAFRNAPQAELRRWLSSKGFKYGSGKWQGRAMPEVVRSKIEEHQAKDLLAVFEIRD